MGSCLFLNNIRDTTANLNVTCHDGGSKLKVQVFVMHGLLATSPYHLTYEYIDTYIDTSERVVAAALASLFNIHASKLYKQQI